MAAAAQVALGDRRVEQKLFVGRITRRERKFPGGLFFHRDGDNRAVGVEPSLSSTVTDSKKPSAIPTPTINSDHNVTTTAATRTSNNNNRLLGFFIKKSSFNIVMCVCVEVLEFFATER